MIIDYSAPGCICANGGMGRRAGCPVHDPEFSADPHTVTYAGSTRLGFTWRCSCGASNGEYPWEGSRERTVEAHEHLRLHMAWPRSCAGCCYDLNKARLNRQKGKR